VLRAFLARSSFAGRLTTSVAGVGLLVGAGVGCGRDVVLYGQPGSVDAGGDAGAKARVDAGIGCPSLDALVAHWPLDEPEGASRFVDRAGGHDAVCDPCPAVLEDGIRGRARTFDEAALGELDSLHVTSDPSVGLTEEVSVLAWVMLHQHGSHAYVVANIPSCTACPARGFALAAHLERGGPAFELGASSAVTAVPGPALTLLEWHHLAGTYDGSTMRLYVDGRLVASTPNIDGFTLAPSYDTWIGGAADDPARGLDGSLDDVQIVGRALDASEIASVYACR
jgi:hypothetical protein